MDSQVDDIIRWIETHRFIKEEPCDCDFSGDWLGDGVCVGCRHPVSYFKDGWCTFPVMRTMGLKDTKEEILKYLRSL